jgi:transcriptional regulator with XRE-family HTH domain
MVNTIMQFCRETNQYSYSDLARHLGISVKEYIELEEGVQLLSSKHTALLAELYHVSGDYFFNAAMLLENIWIKSEIIRGLRAKIEKFQFGEEVNNNPKKHLIVFKNVKRLFSV